VRQDNRWLFYYGGADKYVGVAEAAYGSAASTPPVVRNYSVPDGLPSVSWLYDTAGRRHTIRR